MEGGAVGRFSRKQSSADSVVTKRAFSRRSVEDEVVERETYHGVLRSELDEPTRLPLAFEMLIEETNRARHAFERGECTKIQLAEIFQQLRVIGPDGTEWTLGATSGRWYRRPVGGTWVPALPPEDDADGNSYVDQSRSEKTKATTDVGDDFLANIDALLSGGVEGFGVDEPLRATESVTPWPEVQQDPSDEAPVHYESAASGVIDEHGAWSSQWDAKGEESGDAAFSDLPDLSAFETPPSLEDGGGWAAWGVKPS